MAKSDWIPTGKAGRYVLGVRAKRRQRDPSVRVNQWEHISSTLPKWCPGAKEYVNKPGHPDHGKPIVRNLRDIRNIEAATGLRHDRASRDQSYGWDINEQFRERDD